MGKIPKQRGSGRTGNTSWGHRSNRVSSTRRGGNPHAGGGGGGTKGCALVLLVGLGPALGVGVAALITKITEII